jgi:arylesterase/paraoxonase
MINIHRWRNITMLKRILIGIFIVLALLILFVIKTLYDAGQFRSIDPHFSGRCTPVKLACPEDIDIDPSSGIAFISSSDRRAAMRGEKTQGAIYGYSLRSENPELINLTGDFTQAFHPHGINLYISGGRKLLFVINMGQDAHFHDRTEGSTVEIFEFRQGRLNHQETITGELIKTPNDILGVGPRQFYITNDHGATTPLGKKAEAYLQLAISNIVYYDGSSLKLVAEDLAYANGLALSGDGNTLFATATVGKMMRIYARDRSSGALRALEDIDLETGVDNIDIDEVGNIWAGCLPKLLSFVSYSKDPSKHAPSQVLKILPAGKGYEIREVYLNRGEEISGASSAAYFRGRLLIGASYDDHFLDCRLTE